MPDPNKPQYNPEAKENRYPKALYHPELPMRTVRDADDHKALVSGDDRWAAEPYFNLDGSPKKGGPRKAADPDKQVKQVEEKQSEENKEDDKAKKKDK